MDTSILHITNGDCTTNYLKPLLMQGDFITWREMLCEGKPEVKVGSEKFWRHRFDFLKNSFNFSKRHFININLKEYRKLCGEKTQGKIVLWFENDLFSQINMLAVLSWLKHHRKGRNIFLVTNNSSEAPGSFVPFHQLSETTLNHNYTNKLSLSEDDIAYADYVWQLYCSGDPLQLQRVHQYKANRKLENLTIALASHLRRFPSIENGLNTIENDILTTATRHVYASKNSIVEAIVKKNDLYGFNHLQYIKKINNLQHFFYALSPVQLTNQGKKVQQQIQHAYAYIRNDFTFLGGAKKYNYIYDNSTEKLLKITSL